MSSKNLLQYEETNPSKLKVAKWVSTITNAPIICIPAFLVLCWVFLADNPGKFILVEVICLVFTSVASMAIILFWAKKLNTDKDISNREDRPIPLIVGSVSYFIGFLVLLLVNAPPIITFLLLCYTCNTLIMMLISTQWKISIHTTGLIGPASALILVLGKWGIWLGLLLPIVIWSRVTLKKHTMAQAVVGGLNAYFLTIAEIFLFIYLFNLPTYHVVPLPEIIWIVLALVASPTIIAILGYLKDINKIKKTKWIFYILMIILAIIFAFVGIDYVIIFIISLAITLFITWYGGENFAWYRAIK
ncbi:MAG: hypothetical protein Q4P14_03555 [Methanobacteriaceae archaeon]|nr:hypothetical protein [Methanobacteriaceae archaeon]